MKKIVIFSAVTLAGCATNTLTTKLNDSSVFRLEQRNIIERDLTVPKAKYTTVPMVEDDIDDMVKREAMEQKNDKKPQNKKVSNDYSNVDVDSKGFLIEFGNESTVPTNYGKLKPELLSYLAEKNNIFLIGHSHGASSVGVDKLATMRANAVKYLLEGNGVPSEKIHTLAFWSDAGRSFAPVKGVQILAVDNLSKTPLIAGMSI